MGFKGDPDPLDPYDPRIVVEAVDQIGQTFRPGDYIAYRGYGSLGFGKVISINVLRKDGKPMSGSSMKVHFHWVKKDKNGQWALSYYERTRWNRTTQQYDNGTITPITGNVRHMIELVKVPLTDDQVVDDPTKVTV